MVWTSSPTLHITPEIRVQLQTFLVKNCSVWDLPSPLLNFHWPSMRCICVLYLGSSYIMTFLTHCTWPKLLAMTDVMSDTTTLADRNFSSHSVIVFYYSFGDYGLPLVIIGLSIFLDFFSVNELTSSSLKLFGCGKFTYWFHVHLSLSIHWLFLVLFSC